MGTNAAEPSHLNSTPRYPTVENPATSLTAWLDLIPGGCGGDVLADTEALYDEDWISRTQMNADCSNPTDKR